MSDSTLSCRELSSPPAAPPRSFVAFQVRRWFATGVLMTVASAIGVILLVAVATVRGLRLLFGASTRKASDIAAAGPECPQIVRV